MTNAGNVLSYATVGEIPMRRVRWIVVIQLIQLLVVAGVTCLLVQEWAGLWIGLAEWAGVCALQWLLLMPIVEPRVERGARKSWRYWLAASVLGLFVGVMIATAMGMAGDLLWFFNVLSSEDPDGKRMSETLGWGVGIAGGVVLLASWFVMTPLLVMFMKNRRPEKALFQTASAIFLGTIVEGLSAVGIMSMMNKRSDCVCATFSGLALAGTFAIGFVVFGPGVMLLVLWRRSRFRVGGVCAACGADVSAMGCPDKCPECGVGWKTARL